MGKVTSHPAPNAEVTSLLSPVDIQRLRKNYEGEEVTDLLAAALPRDYELAKPYTDAIIRLFYLDRLPDVPDRDALSVQDRERCIIALLAAENEKYTLGVHLYLGLMEGIRVQEIANILLLAGVYGGVNRFAEGMLVARETFSLLADFAKKTKANAPKEILAAIKARFSPARNASGNGRTRRKR